MSFVRALVRAVIPLQLRKVLVDAMEGVFRQLPGEPAGLPQHGLGETQVYPKGANLLKVLQAATKEKLADLQLEPDTPVASIGTCFAEEFAFFMTHERFNYIRTEDDDVAASANWGRVYTIPNLLQIIRYSVEQNYPVLTAHSNRGWFDPLREARKSTYFESADKGRAAILDHRRASRRAFADCRILIVTVGQNEAWFDKSSGHFWAKNPPREVLNARRDDFSVHEFSFAQNVAGLMDAVKILQSLNPGLKIVFTVSPVASWATFSDKDVVSRSFANKCILRAAVDNVVASQPGRLFYFPSFEMVLCDNPRNFRADNRHVKYAAVARIFSLLSNSTSLHEGRATLPPRETTVPLTRGASVSNKH